MMHTRQWQTAKTIGHLQTFGLHCVVDIFNCSWQIEQCHECSVARVQYKLEEKDNVHNDHVKWTCVSVCADSDVCVFGQRCKEVKVSSEDRNTQWWISLWWAACLFHADPVTSVQARWHYQVNNTSVSSSSWLYQIVSVQGGTINTRPLSTVSQECTRYFTRWCSDTVTMQ